MTDTIEQGVETKRDRILEGALRVFLAYGFQRTTMEDIARSAEISRPALYLEFRNKTDIYRALSSQFLTRALGLVATGLAGGGSLEERLARAIGSVMDMVSEVEEAPHGAELLDMKNRLAGDIMTEGRVKVSALVKEAVAESMARTGGSPEGAAPDVLGDMLLDAIDGMKLRQLPLDEQRRLCRQYIRAVAALAERQLA